ncbi:MAG: hypothetical protein ACREE7_00175 [Dongiaceae bacterium]
MLGWLVRVVIFLLVLGFAAFEAGAIVVAKVSVDGTADTAAREAALEYARSRDEAVARGEAERKANQGGATVVGFTISPDGQFVTVTLQKIAQTMVVQRIGPLRNHRVARATHTAKVG